MRKRLVIGLLSAGLVGAMLPGVAGAAPDLVYVCHFPDHVNSESFTNEEVPTRDYLLEGPQDIATCESYGAKVFRMSATAADKAHIYGVVYVCHFPDHVNSDPETEELQAGDFLFWGSENIATCESYGAQVFRMSYTAAVKLHTDNTPGP